MDPLVHWHDRLRHRVGDGEPRCSDDVVISRVIETVLPTDFGEFRALGHRD